MISLKTVHRSAATRASHYYADQKDDYYSRDGTAAQWQGKAAEALGLTGTIYNQDEFLAALRGDFGPDIKLSKSIRLDSEARAALDITFSPPKSVSIQALIGKDAAAIAAHDKAVTAALEFIESELVRARQTERGVTTTERTGNAVIAKFRHETARPTEGHYCDPQLHTHAVMMNITQRADGRWTAISNDEIFRLKSLAESVYHAELASELERAGHTIRYDGKSFELAHISREQIEGLSKRSGDINAELEAMGLDRKTASRELKQTITLKTRKGKAPEVTREELQRDWERQATELGVDFNRERAPAQKLREHSPDALALVADECLKWAIKHHTERESVMDGKALLKTALLHSRGSGVKLRDLKAAVRRSLDKGHLILGTLEYRLPRSREGEGMSRAAWIGEHIQNGMTKKQAETHVRQAISRGQLVPTGARYTTQVAREREKRILQIEREGRGAVEPILQADSVQAALGGRSLKPGQLAAAELMLTSADRFVGVQGLAGTGKSHMLKQVKAAAESAGFTVKAVASYGKQIEALRELGMEARTVASVLEAHHQDRFKLDANTVLVIDEAGVVPARIMERLMKMAEADGARVVMLGDTGQTKAIEAGRPFHQLQAAGMATALMGDIVRQKSPELKEAVEFAARGQASTSLGVIDTKLQAVHTIGEDVKRYQRIAGEYAAQTVDDRRETLIVTGTNKSRNALNEATHQALGLAGRGFDFNLLTRRDTTQAERRVAHYYRLDDIIQPERDYKLGDLKQDEMYRVIGATGKANELEVEHLATKTRSTFNPARATKLSVYQPVEAELSAGDWVRVTRNNAELDLVNGGRFEVLAVTPTTVTIGNGGRRLTLDASVTPLHLDRAYATTSHSAQGLTCNRVLINAESYSRTTQRDVYYVAISRARHQADIYTDDAGKLRRAVNRLEEKTAALDIGMEKSRPWRPKETVRSMEKEI
ncbi:relaxase domain-containing protein [Achromobacter xylosoxidans]|uniref:MobF family relaxase n=1 Tax=Alcaligenes xylosoxydans xylosoxydans TaxID=85698 RepID=UPI001F060DB5|nr:MobF family relaxase [Achromobacter xylosoxidans]MCH1986474.1 relaxase domain-containing protein [Achromobacter xylosoxidans]MCH1992276.1 relaxase domain-containing protein [Achromobacter xylosoxidans]MCH4586595.1 relaxase domain-containing protein [Achromobacter xylosoxidans]